VGLIEIGPTQKHTLCTIEADRGHVDDNLILFRLAKRNLLNLENFRTT
jgi:hypothetical protein